MENLRIGIAVTDIELVTGMDMTGFLARTSGSAGIHDNLKIKCVFIDDGITQFVLVVNDLLALDSRFTSKCIVDAAKKLGILPDNVVIACIHTHSGPASIFLQDCGEVVGSWLESLKASILECIIKASKNLKLSTLTYKTARCNIGYNRVVNDKTQAAKLVDNQVGVIEVSDSITGLIDALIVNYACHPVVLGGALYTRDYPNYVIEGLRQKPGYENAEIIYTSGCCGDINPLERGDFQKAEKLGHELADSIGGASSILPDQKGFSQVPLIVRSLKIDIPLTHDLDRETIAKLQKEYSQGPKEETDGDFNGVAEKVQRAYLHWTQNMLKRIEDRVLEKSVDADIKIIRIGNFTIVTLPFEVFHEIGLKIKEHFGPERTIVVCYANGDFGYLPSKALYDQAKTGYEAGSAFRFYGYPGPVAYEAEDILLNEIFKLEGG